MADFFSDLFDSITGQQATPQQTIIPTSDLLSQSYATLNGQIAPGLVGFNKALAPGLTDVQLGVTNQLDPSILSNLRGANKSILDQLNLGSSLGSELQNDVITNALQGAAASGFGVSNGGRGLVAKDLGLTGLNLLRQRQQDALRAGQTGLAAGESLYDPAKYTGLGAQLATNVGADIRGIQAAKDEMANLAEDIRRQNFSSLINTGGRILGTVVGGVVGAYTGNPVGGAQAGGAIGGSILGRTGVAGYSGGAGAGAGGTTGKSFNLSGLFSGFGGGGGGGGFTGDIGGGSFAGYA